MKGHRSICKAIMTMLTARLPETIAALADEGIIVAPPVMINMDARRAYQVGQLPMIEVIPQRMVSLREVEQNWETNSRVYRMVYGVRIDMGCAPQEDYAAVAGARLDLLLAVRETLLNNQELRAYSTGDREIGLESVSLTEAVGPITEYGSGQWWGQCTININVFAMEELARPAYHLAPLTLVLDLSLLPFTEPS